MFVKLNTGNSQWDPIYHVVLVKMEKYGRPEILTIPDRVIQSQGEDGLRLAPIHFCRRLSAPGAQTVRTRHGDLLEETTEAISRIGSQDSSRKRASE